MLLLIIFLIYHYYLAGFKDGTIMLWILDTNMQIDISGKLIVIVVLLCFNTFFYN